MYRFRIALAVFPLAFAVALLLLIPSCNDDATGSAPGNSSDPGLRPPPDLESPSMGHPMFRKSYDWLDEEVALLEKKAGQSQGGAGPTEQELRQLERGIDNMIKALEVSLAAEGRQERLRKNALMRRENMRLEQEKSRLYTELGERRDLVERINKGVAPVPAGRTRAEMDDLLADAEIELRELLKKQQQHLDAMEKLREEVKEGVTTPLEETLLSQEMRAFESLRARVEALR